MKRYLVFILILILSLNIILAQEINNINVKKISSTEINLPKLIDTVIKGIFQIEDEKVTISLLVTILIIWLIIIKLLIDIFQLVPFFDKKIIGVPTAIIIATIISSTGVVKEIVLFTLALETLYMVIALIIIVIILVLISKFLKLFKKIKTAGEVTVAEIRGMKAGESIERAKIQNP